MRVGLIGCVESSRRAFETLLSLEEVRVEAVVTKESSAQNADYVELSPICSAHNICCHFYEAGNEKEMARFLSSADLDVVFCIGWSHILSKDILQSSRYGVIGFHPAPLPRNRGRHPIIWALALGLEKTASTFFWMEEGVDDGAILSQKWIDIAPHDTSSVLYQKIMDVAVNQIYCLILAMRSGRVNSIPQDPEKATYWRKRTRADGIIHWSMSADTIYNLVRALAPPYPCAEFHFRHDYVAVLRCEKMPEKYPLDIEPGKVLWKESESLVVKCAGPDAVKLWVRNNVTLPQLGEYL